MRFPFIHLALALGVAVAACAKASSFQGGDGGGSTDGSGAASATTDAQSSSSAAASTTAATTSSSGTGGGSSSSASSGSGGACAESPCKLVAPQCGCAANQACTVDNQGTRSCIGAGSAPIDAVCDGLSKCAPGGLCLQISPTVATCGEFCSTDAQCTPPGGICVLTLNDGMGGTVPGVTLCSTNCDPTTNSGCAIAKTSCQGAFDANSSRAFTICSGAGAGTQGAACTDSNQCAPTFGCFNAMPTQCLKWCNVGLQNCPNAKTCVSLADPILIGATEYGACL